ncbi:MAG: hypothetical protein QM811_31815 [Pirellulales bacterium]
MTLPNGINLGRLENRRNLLGMIDTIRRESDQSGLMDGLDAFTQKAFEMVTSPAGATRLRPRFGRRQARAKATAAIAWAKAC